jgi:hypothetical protein
MDPWPDDIFSCSPPHAATPLSTDIINIPEYMSQSPEHTGPSSNATRSGARTLKAPQKRKAAVPRRGFELFRSTWMLERKIFANALVSSKQEREVRQCWQSLSRKVQEGWRAEAARRADARACETRRNAQLGTIGNLGGYESFLAPSQEATTGSSRYITASLPPSLGWDNQSIGLSPQGCDNQDYFAWVSRTHLDHFSSSVI